MGLTESYKKREQENINKAVSKLKKDTANKTEREILLEILHRVKLISYSILGLILFIFVAYLFGWFN